MIKKQKKIIIISLIAIVVLALTYVVLKATVLWGLAAKSDKKLAVISDMSFFERVGEVLKGGDGTMDADELRGNHGEKIINDRPLIFDQVERANIQELVVHNEFGGFRLYRGSDGELYFEGAEALYYDSQKLAQLVVSTGYLLAMQEVEDYNTDLSVYGLDEQHISGWFEMTTTGGEYYKVLIGDKIVTSGGYYVMLDGRDAVYILDTGLETSVLVDVRTYLVAQVAISIPQDSYYTIDDFSLVKNGEPFISIDTELTYEDDGKTISNYSYSMKYPGEYVPSSSNYGKVLSSFINFTGDSVAEYGISRYITDENGDNPEFIELMQKYGFYDENNKLYYQLSYSYQNRTTTLYISKKSENNTYYICSPSFELIAEFSADSLPWLEWDLIKWVAEPLYQQSIDLVETYEVISHTTGASAKFSLSGEGDRLTVKLGNNTVDTKNFRQLYKQFLYCQNDGYADNADNVACSFEIISTLRDGTVYDFKFYDVATRKSYYTVNGKGEFYTSRDNLKKMNSDLTDILAGKTVEAQMQ